MYIYRTYFRLEADVNDFDAAREYLSEDDMTPYLKRDHRISKEIADAVSHIEWILSDTDSGHIDLITFREMTEDELKSISRWVSGQNSDGLGEGFEQQDFANYRDGWDDEYDEDEADDYYDDYVMASFDWRTNDYIFDFLRKD